MKWRKVWAVRALLTHTLSLSFCLFVHRNILHISLIHQLKRKLHNKNLHYYLFIKFYAKLKSSQHKYTYKCVWRLLRVAFILSFGRLRSFSFNVQRCQPSFWLFMFHISHSTKKKSETENSSIELLTFVPSCPLSKLSLSFYFIFFSWLDFLCALHASANGM